MYFCYFVIISPWIRATQGCFVPSLVEIDSVVLHGEEAFFRFRGPSFKTNLNPLHPRMLCFVPSFVEFGPLHGSGERYV